MDTRLKALESQSYALDIQIQHIQRRMAQVENNVALITAATDTSTKRTRKQELNDLLSSLFDDLQQTIPKLEALQKQEFQPRARSRCAAVFDAGLDSRDESATDEGLRTADEIVNEEENQVVLRVKTVNPNIMKGTSSLNQSNASNSSDTTTEEVRKQLLSLLNKLVPSNFDALVAKFLRLKLESNAECPRLIAQLVFEKAINEPSNMGLYIRFIQYMCRSSASSAKRLRKEILDRLQAEFCRLTELEHVDSNSQGDCLKPEDSGQKRTLAVVQLVAEFFKYHLLTTKVVCECVHVLFNAATEESLLSLCKLLEYAGELLEANLKDLCERARDAKQPLPKFVPEEDWMEKTFALLKTHASDTKLSMRARILLTELIELRERSWEKRKPNEDGSLYFGQKQWNAIAARRGITAGIESKLASTLDHEESGRANVHHLPVPDLIPCVNEVSQAHTKTKKRKKKKKTLLSVEQFPNLSCHAAKCHDDCQTTDDNPSCILAFDSDKLSYWRHRQNASYNFPLCDSNTVDEFFERDLPKFLISIPPSIALISNNGLISEMPFICKREEIALPFESEARADIRNLEGSNDLPRIDCIQISCEEEEAWQRFLFNLSLESSRRVVLSNIASSAFLKFLLRGNNHDVQDLINGATANGMSGKKSYYDQFLILLEEAFLWSFAMTDAPGTATMSHILELHTKASAESIRILFLRFLVTGYYHSFITFDIFKSKFLDPLFEAEDTLPWFSWTMQSAARKLWVDVFLADYSEDTDNIIDWWFKCEHKIGKIFVADYTNNSSLVISSEPLQVQEP